MVVEGGDDDGGCDEAGDGAGEEEENEEENEELNEVEKAAVRELFSTGRTRDNVMNPLV